MSRHRQNGLSFVLKKILTWVLREAKGGLKTIAGKRLETLSHSFFVTFCFFQPECCFPGQAVIETISAHRHRGLKPG